jgi:hypothetical protein
MRVRYKRRVAIAALAAITLIARLTFTGRPPATVTALAVTLIGYTNALPGGNWRFALFSVSNQAPYTVRGYEDSVDVWGFPAIKRPAIHPAYAPALELKAGQSVLTAVEEPFDLPTGRWRYVMSFSRYTWRTWWYDKSLTRKWLPLRVGPVVLADSLNPTNRVTVTTAWLTK